MRALPLLLLLSTCVAGEPAFAADGCRPITEVISIAQNNHWENVVIRGPAVAVWVGVVTGHELELSVEDPDFVMIQFAPNAAIIWFGKGDEVCDPIMGPPDEIRRLLRDA